MNDAFGKAIWAYFKGKDSCEIIERDDGYFDATGVGIYFSRYEDWPKHEKVAMRYVRGRVLDIGCGAGRHSLYLQKKSFDVTGIDISPLAIKACRLRGLRKARLMSITQVSFEPNPYDTILMLGNNFGLLGSPKRGRLLLRKFHRMTSRGALIVAESNDPYETRNPDHLRYHKLNVMRGRMPGQLRIRVRFGRCVGKWFDYLMVSRDEMRKALEGTGWNVRRFISSGGSQYIAIIAKSD
ncbi:MAG: class I SAM-dependent methyltransferase [Thermoproteota archaeon]